MANGTGAGRRWGSRVCRGCVRFHIVEPCDRVADRPAIASRHRERSRKHAAAPPATAGGSVRWV